MTFLLPLEPQEKNLVHSIVRAYLEGEAPEEIADFEEDFDFLLDEMERLAGTIPAKARPSGGRLPFDGFFADPSLVASVTCMAVFVVLELVRGHREQRLLQVMEELEATIASTVSGPSRISQSERPVSALFDVVERPEMVAQIEELRATQSHAVYPDLELLIRQVPGEREPTFTFDLNSPDPSLKINHRQFGPVALKKEPGLHFTRLFNEICDLPLEAKSAADVAPEILELGAALGEDLLPSVLGEVLLRLFARYEGKLTLLIQSEEPWIPWELVRLPQGPFLCEAFALARWLQGRSQYDRFALRRLGIVMPRDTGLSKLAEELSFLEGLRAEHREVKRILATPSGLRGAFAKGIYDGWHFSGHGLLEADPDHSAILLDDCGRFTPLNLTGEARALGNCHPLVFLNACFTGRSGMSLTGIGGWANGFLKAKAGAFLGAYWAVEDKSARRFAEAFYTAFLDGIAIAESVRQARLAIRSSDPIGWLAYTLYAHPLAVLQQVR